MASRSYKVVYLSTGVSINNVVMIDEATDTGSGEIPSAVVVLNAEQGAFITDPGLVGSVNTTPIISQFDLLQLTFTDDNGFQYQKIYFVDKLIPKKNQQEGVRLELHCLARERFVQMIDFAFQFFYVDGFTAGKFICDFYNKNKGANQPTIVNQGQTQNWPYLTTPGPYTPQGNFLPVWTSHIFDFSNTELGCYDALIEITDKEGTTAPAGGANDFFDTRFDDDPSNQNQIKLNIFSSGSTAKSGTPPLITGIAVNMPEASGGIESQQATLIKAWGAEDQGSLPTDFSKFVGIDQMFFEFPVWQSGVVGGYPVGASVQYDNGSGVQVFINNVAGNTNSPTGGGWSAQAEYNYLGSLQYSPWTNGKAIHWGNCGADPNADFWGHSMWDGNLVIQDGTYYRTWVDARSPDLTTFPANTFITNTKINDNGAPPNKVFYRGYRVLVDTNLGPVAGILAQNGGKDRFGNTYANAIIQHNGQINNASGTQYKSWDVAAGVTLSASNNSQALQILNNWGIGLRRESKVYIYSTGLSSWVDASAQAKKQDCFHPYNFILNASGISDIPTSGGGTYGDNSAIQIMYQFSAADILAGLVSTSKNYFAAGAWLNIAIPYPLTIDQTPMPDVGYLYGGSGQAVPEPATINSVNMSYTHLGNVGFNHSESDDLGPLSALTFQLKILLAASGSPTTPLSLFGATYANIPCRALMYDTQDNVVYQDFTVPFINLFAPISLPLSQFQIYRARIPLGWGDLNSLVPPPQLNVQNVFLWRDIKQIVIQIQDVYDDQGRYKPEGSNLIRWMLSATPVSQSCQITMWLDAFNFTKPLLSTSGPVVSSNIEVQTLERKFISNKQQLDAECLAQLQIYQFQHIEYEITTDIRCDIAFGDSFYFKDTETVPKKYTDYLGQASTLKLVAKRVSYSVNKKDGPGGLLTTILGVKRLNSN